jgi:integrase
MPGARVVGGGITAQAIYNTIIDYAEELEKKGVAPHDLRRTFANLAHKGGAAIDQTQLSLGHESIQTTEEYLGALSRTSRTLHVTTWALDCVICGA